MIGVGKEGSCSAGAAALGGAKVIVILGAGAATGGDGGSGGAGSASGGTGMGSAVEVTVCLGIKVVGTAALVCWGWVVGGAAG